MRHKARDSRGTVAANLLCCCCAAILVYCSVRYLERKSCGFKNIRIRVDGTLVDFWRQGWCHVHVLMRIEKLTIRWLSKSICFTPSVFIILLISFFVLPHKCRQRYRVDLYSQLSSSCVTFTLLLKLALFFSFNCYCGLFHYSKGERVQIP